MDAIVYSLAGSSAAIICSPVPWARKVSAIGNQQIDPPQPLDLAHGGAMCAEKMAALDVAWAETETEFIERVRAASVPPEAENVRVVNVGEIPTDRMFRAALKHDFTYDMKIVGEILKKQIDDDAERERMRDLTPGTGMAATYAEKRDQANAVHEMEEAAANALTEAERIAQFPTLAASVGVEADTLWECAAIVIAKSEAQTDRTFNVERTRLAARKAVKEARDLAAAKAAYEAIRWK